MVVGIRQTSSEISTKIDCGDARINRHGLQRYDSQKKDDRQAREQNIEGDLVRRLLALGPFHQLDHPVQKRFARIRSDAHDDFVGQHARAAGDRRAVAA